MEDTSRNQPIDLRDVLRPVKARLWLIIVCVSLATALTYYHYSSQPKEYRASTTLYLGSNDPTQILTPIATDRETTDLATLVNSSDIYTLAAKQLGLKGRSAAALGAVSATPVSGSDFVSVQAISGSSVGAAALANAAANAFVSHETEVIHFQASQAIAQDQRELSALPNTLDNATQRGQLQQSIQQLENIKALPTVGVSHINPAFPPGAPFAPNPKKNAIFAFVISLLLTIAGAFGLDRLDRRIRKLPQIADTYGLPVLAAIPRTLKPAAAANGVATLPDDLREAFRTLRLNLELASLEQRPKLVAVASAVSREGKSTVVRNLALACREAGLEVCVVDADLRRPRLAELLNVPTVPGLTDVVVGDETLPDALKRAEADVRGLRTLARLQSASEVAVHAGSEPAFAPGRRRRELELAPNGNGAGHGTGNGEDVGSLIVLPAGPEPANPPVVLGSDRMRSILTKLTENFDIVLVDTPPLLAVSDAVPLLSMSDAVLLVSRLGTTTSDVAKDVVEQIRRIPGANTVGVIANDVHGRELNTKHHYSYAYSNARTTE